MFASEAVTGRTVLVVLEPGDDVLPALAEACRVHAVRSAVIPVFLGAFREVRIIGAAEPPADEDALMPDAVTVRNSEGLGSGTVTPGPEGPLIHLHVAVGAKGASAAATAGHLLGGIVQYPVEVVLTEVLEPALTREPNAQARGLPTLTFATARHDPAPAP
ncbi:MAG: DNA-binding protein [Herbiconiux sp.]|nr:DNA-binding protein [Herbiconiux sp.]